MLFSTKPKDMSIERMMTSVPGFPPAKDLYSGTKHITVTDLADTELITNKMLGILCNAMAIRRYGMKAVEIAKKEGEEKC